VTVKAVFTGDGMKTLKLLQFEFFRGLADTFKGVTLEDLKEICPGDPIPLQAVVAGEMPEHLKLFLALLTMVDTRLQQDQAAFDAATNSDNYDEGPSLSDIRSQQENATILESLFWHLLRSEVPPPAEFDHVAEPQCGYGPNFEVYYTSEEIVGPELPRSSQSFELAQETPFIH
jgi:hypothetical protein